MNIRFLAVKFIRGRLFKAMFSLGCVLAIVWLTVSLVDLSSKKGVQSEQQTELNQVLAQNSDLKKKLDEAKTPEFVEKVAREQLGLVKPGESVVIMNTTPLRPSEAGFAGQANELENLPNWKKWWKLFF